MSSAADGVHHYNDTTSRLKAGNGSVDFSGEGFVYNYHSTSLSSSPESFGLRHFYVVGSNLTRNITI